MHRCHTARLYRRFPCSPCFPVAPDHARLHFTPMAGLFICALTIRYAFADAPVQIVKDPSGSATDTMMKDQLLDELLRVSRMRTSEEVAVFDRTVQALSGQRFSRQELGVLFSMFADDTPHHEVMYGLLHLIEQSRDEGVIAALIESAPDMQRVAPEWLETFICRVLNHDPARDVLIASLRDMPSMEGAAEVISVVGGLKENASDRIRANASMVVSALM